MRCTGTVVASASLLPSIRRACLTRFAACVVRCVVCGVLRCVQGVRTILTDPQIHSAGGGGGGGGCSYGDGNLGEAGMKYFFRSHTCNSICAKLALKPHPEWQFQRPAQPLPESKAAPGAFLCTQCGKMFEELNENGLTTALVRRRDGQDVLCGSCRLAPADARDAKCSTCGDSFVWSPKILALRNLPAAPAPVHCFKPACQFKRVERTTKNAEAGNSWYSLGVLQQTIKPPLHNRTKDVTTCQFGIMCGGDNEWCFMLPACNHACCEVCFIAYVTSQIQQNPTHPDVSCGVKGCVVPIDRTRFQHFQFDSEINAAAAQNASLQLLLNRNKSLFVLCPKCSLLVRDESSSGRRIMRCATCGYRSCTWCKVTPTSTNTDLCTNSKCAENPVFAAIRNNRETKTIGSVSGVPTIRLCPECQLPTKHWRNCKHINCTMCHLEWCFVCLAKRNKTDGSWPCGQYFEECKVAPPQLPPPAGS